MQGGKALSSKRVGSVLNNGAGSEIKACEHGMEALQGKMTALEIREMTQLRIFTASPDIATLFPPS